MAASNVEVSFLSYVPYNFNLRLAKAPIELCKLVFVGRCVSPRTYVLHKIFRVLHFHTNVCAVQFTNCIIPPFWFITICFTDTIIFIYYVWAFFKFMIHMNSPRPTTTQKCTYAHRTSIHPYFLSHFATVLILFPFFLDLIIVVVIFPFTFIFSPVHFILKTFKTHTKAKRLPLDVFYAASRIYFFLYACPLFHHFQFQSIINLYE